MDKIELSIIFPFRERLDYFHTLMQSLIRTTTQPSRIEILIAVDDDDQIVLEQIDALQEIYFEFRILFFVRPRSVNFIKNYWNFLAEKAQGRWILAINDDSEFKTDNWDEILLTKMNAEGDRLADDILHGLIKDGINRRMEDPLFPHFSCWCLQSKEAVNALGYFYPPKYKTQGADHAVSKTYKNMGRLVSLTEIFIDGKHSKDLSEEEIAEESIKLQNYIYEKEKKRHGG